MTKEQPYTQPVLAFIHIEKAAGITINHILRRQFGMQHCDLELWDKSADVFTASDYQRLHWLYPQLKSIAGHRVKPYSDLERAFPNIMYYTFMREPIARCASHFQFQIQVRGMNHVFEKWIQEEKYRNFMVRKIAGSDDLDRAIDMLRNKLIFVGLVERFNESLVLFRQRISNVYDLDISYSKENVAADNSIKNDLLNDPAKRAALEDANQLDMQLYKFITETLYPEQMRAYGAGLASDLQAFEASHDVDKINSREILGRLKRNLVYKPVLFYAHRSKS